MLGTLKRAFLDFAAIDCQGKENAQYSDTRWNIQVVINQLVEKYWHLSFFTTFFKVPQLRMDSVNGVATGF